MTERARPLLGARVADMKAAAFDLIPEPSLVIDPEGALVAVNDAAEALFGQ
ncbi:MAG: PAS domain-containing protein, partial [Caulobacter sp.]